MRELTKPEISLLSKYTELLKDIMDKYKDGYYGDCKEVAIEERISDTLTILLLEALGPSEEMKDGNNNS